jgi:hypothetical protein
MDESLDFRIMSKNASYGLEVVSSKLFPFHLRPPSSLIARVVSAK